MSVASLGDWIGKWAHDGLRNALHESTDDLKSAAQAGGDAAGDKAAGIFTDGGFSILDLLGVASGGLLAITEKLLGLTHWVRSIAEGWALGSFFSEVSAPAWQTFVQDANRAFTPTLLDPSTAAKLDSQRVAIVGGNEHEAAGSGMDAQKYEALRAGAYTQPGLDVLLELQRRGLSGPDDTVYGLHRGGLDEGFVGKVQGLIRVLLSPADLALANLRGELDDQPTFDYANQLGVDEFDMRLLIGNTGEPPGPQELMTAWRRGFIGPERFDRGIRESRIRPEWLDVMRALRHGPMATADAVRAVVQNYLTSDEGKAIAQQNGLAEDQWNPLLQSAGRPISHEQAMKLLYRGIFHPDDVAQAVRESDIKNKYLPYIEEINRRLIPGRTITAMLNHNVIKHDLAVRKLRELGFNAEDAALLVNYGTHEHVAAAKDLTKSDLLALYRDSILNHDEAKSKLTGLGYTAAVAGYLLKLEDAKAHAAVIRTEQTRIRGSLDQHRLTKDEAIKELEHAGIDPQQAAGLVARWMHERGAVTRALTEAQILKIRKANLINDEQALTRFEALGLAQDDAHLLLRSYGYFKSA